MAINARTVAAALVAVAGVAAAAWQFREQMRPPAKVERVTVTTPPDARGRATGAAVQVDPSGLPKEQEAKREAIADQLGVKPEQVRLETDAPPAGAPHGSGLIEGPFAYARMGDSADEPAAAIRGHVAAATAGNAQFAGAAEPAAQAILAPFAKGAEDQPGLVAALRKILDGAEFDASKAQARPLGDKPEPPRGVGVMKMAASRDAMSPEVLKKPRVEVRLPVKLKSPATKDGEVELTAELVRQPDGSWNVLSYGFAAASQAVTKELGQAMRGARQAIGGSR